MDSDISRVRYRLRQSRTLIHALRAPSTSGVYAAFLRDNSGLKPFTPGRDGVIYVGVSSDLSRRELENHFNSGGTGFSTLRRSLGAILKQPLALTAIARSDGLSETNIRNFRFVEDGEVRLTEWMRNNLEVGICDMPNCHLLEAGLIAAMEPLLNLTSWPNPDRAELKRLRKLCADEVRSRS